MQINKIISLWVIIVLAGCSSSKPPVNSKDFPDWYLNPPKVEGKYFGVGDAKRPQPSLSKSVATMRARAEISRAIDARVSSEIKQYMDASGIGSDASALEYTQEVVTSISSNVLKGSVIEKTEVIDGTIYVLASYDLEAAKRETKAAMRAAAKKEEALYNEFKAKNAFKEFDAKIDSMNSSSSVAEPE